MHGGFVTRVVSKEEENMVLSSEDSSCPYETELELGLGLSLGLKGQRDSSRVHSSDSSDSSSFSSSLSRANDVSGAKRTADSVAAVNGSGQKIGWPPIKTYRMNSFVNQAKSPATEEINSAIEKARCKDLMVEKNCNGSFSSSMIRSSMFVKVNMDGKAIGRKVDLNSHSSYEALAKTLEEMFLQPPTTLDATHTQEFMKIAETRPSKLLDGSSGFLLTYEDKEGDWMLVGDVPWGMFLGSAKRLRIMRTSEATGIGERNEM